MKYLLLSCVMILSHLIPAQKLGLSDYDKPELLLKLEAYEKQGGSFKSLGFDELNDKSFVSDIPIDVVPFATAEHFHIGFLSDFGRIKDLSQAPIVLINSAPFEKVYTVALVAENLETFLALVCKAETVHLIDYLENREYMTGADYDEMLYDMEHGSLGGQSSVSKEEWMQNLRTDRKNAIEYISMQIGDVQIDSISPYLDNLKAQRMADITIETVDELGIVYQQERQPIKPFNYENEITLDMVKEYLSAASQAERLKFYRDATTNLTYQSGDTYLFDRMDKADVKELKKIMYEYLSRDGYDYEARVLKKFYK